MLSAAGPRLRPPAPRANNRLPWAGLASAGLHAVLALALVGWGPRRPEGQPPIEVEFIDRAAQTPGAPASAPPTTPPSAAQAATAEGGDAPSPAPPSTPRPATPAPRSEVNLGDSTDDVAPLTVTGENVTPAAPDSRFRNQPPGYPAAAARIRAAGTVGLMIRVTAAGLVGDVLVAKSSGYPVLDEEAMRAVRRWRFKPARDGGQAVPFDYALNIKFSLQ